MLFLFYNPSYSKQLHIDIITESKKEWNTNSDIPFFKIPYEINNKLHSLDSFNSFDCILIVTERCKSEVSFSTWSES